MCRTSKIKRLKFCNTPKHTNIFKKQPFLNCCILLCIGIHCFQFTVHLLTKQNKTKQNKTKQNKQEQEQEQEQQQKHLINNNHATLESKLTIYYVDEPE